MEFAAHLDGSFLLFFFHMYHIYDPSPDHFVKFRSRSSGLRLWEYQIAFIVFNNTGLSRT